MSTAATYTGSPTFTNVTLSATPDTLTEVTLPAGKYRVSLQAKDTAAYVTVSGSDGGAAGANARALVPANSIIEFSNFQRSRFYLGSSTAGQICAVILEAP